MAFITRTDIASLIVTEPQTTFIVRGQPGIGKTSLAYDIQRALPSIDDGEGNQKRREVIVIDCTLVSEGDVAIPVVQPGGQVVRYAVNDLFAPASGAPIIVLDEFGKASPNVQAMFAPMILERRIFGYKLPADTIVIPTSNLESDNVGENEMQGHTCNRMCFVEMKNPTAEDWVGWFQNNAGFSCPEVVAFAMENPALFHCYADGGSDTNTWIYNPNHPTQSRHFVSPRSLTSAALTVKNHREGRITTTALSAALAGKIGASAAALLVSYVSFARDMPRVADIAQHGAKACAPKNAAQHLMLASSLIGHLDTVIKTTKKAGGSYTPEQRDEIITNVLDYIYGDKDRGIKAVMNDVAAQLGTYLAVRMSTTYLITNQKRISDSAMALNMINRVMGS